MATTPLVPLTSAAVGTPPPNVVAAAILPGVSGHIAYDRDASIYVMSSDGTSSHRLTTNGFDEEPAWSRDGNHIAFVRQVGLGHSHIFVMDRLGGHVRQVTFGSQDDFHPSWSPDGSEIAFGRGLSRTAIFIVHVQTLRVRRVSDGAGSVAWSPDGMWLAIDVVVNGRVGLFLERRDGTNRSRITPTAIRATAPDWSTDGKQLCFVLVNNSAGDTSTWSSDVALIQADGTGLRRLTRRHQGLDLKCSWSPNNRYIAFQRTIFSTPTVPASDRIHTVRLDTSSGRVIPLPMPNTSGANPDWGR
jgi:TolB protein